SYSFHGPNEPSIQEIFGSVCDSVYRRHPSILTILKCAQKAPKDSFEHSEGAPAVREVREVSVLVGIHFLLRTCGFKGGDFGGSSQDRSGDFMAYTYHSVRGEEFSWVGRLLSPFCSGFCSDIHTID